MYAELAGVQFRPKETKEIVKMLNIGDELKLQRDPGNEHHVNAIKVLDEEGNWLGFVNKDVADEIAGRLDDGADYTCTVDTFLSTTKPQLKIVFAGEEDEEEDESVREAAGDAD